jgi:chemotaxis protein methyltransferase CheR
MGAPQIAADESAALTELRGLLTREAGLTFADNKAYLFEQRLRPVMDRAGLADFEQLTARVAADMALRHEVIHAMTTHETSFFRDGHPFEALQRTVIPALLGELADERRRGTPRRPFAAWSAGCSSGQEALSLAMLLHGELGARPHLGLGQDAIQVLATDVSPMVVDEARRGRFAPGMATRGLPDELAARYFEPDAQELQVGPLLRALVTYRVLNLASMFTLGPIGLVLCRNVLIYFDGPTAVAVTERLRRSMTMGGLLLLGSSETLRPEVQGFEPVVIGRTRMYRRIA